MKNHFSTGTWLFIRTLAAVHLIAFISFWVQLDGLIGPHGILPAGRFFAAAHAHLGAAAYARVPSLCWLFGTGWFLPALCAAGVALSLLLFAGIAPGPCLALLWAAALSLDCAGQIFYDFQWDALLLETTFLAIFLVPWTLRRAWRVAEPPRLAHWLLAWLLFRLMLLSGVVKLASGDPTWRQLTALFFHFETQPLPTPVAWYAHHLPTEVLRGLCALMFAIEFAAPLALAGPRTFRHAGVLAIVGFQLAIAATGNYAYFNLLTIALCLPCLDDAWWQRVLPEKIAAWASRVPRQSTAQTGPCSQEITGGTPVPPPELTPSGVIFRAFAVFVIVCTSLEAVADFSPRVANSPPVDALLQKVVPFRTLNNYGLFAVMTTTRPELIFEGSDNGTDWKPYELPHQPGSTQRRPDFVAPYQPRLDWQLWFAALAPPDQNPWVYSLCERLLRGDPSVLGLFAANPFPGKPPHYLRVVRYQYHFSDRATRARTGQWWTRTVQDLFVPKVSLKQG